jgi:hypothetical protein
MGVKTEREMAIWCQGCEENSSWCHGEDRLDVVLCSQVLEWTISGIARLDKITMVMT